jgi:hypothetical protein
MKQVAIFSCFLFLFFSSGLKGQSFKPENLTAGQWATDWLLCGPFDLVKNDDVFAHCTGFETDYLKKSGGEQSIRVRAGDKVKFTGGSNTWRYYHSTENILNLDNAISTKEPVFGYAYTEVNVPEPGFWKISFGSNDGGRLWVNGKQVWDL